MNNHYKLLFSLFVGLMFSASAFAQPCTPNTSFTQPGIYPDTMPTGTALSPYSENITFVMPLDTMNIDFTNFKIVSVSLPVGLSWECNNASNGCNYNPQVNQYGCVNVSGTPLIAGVYNVAVTALADLTIAAGIPVEFNVYLEILPAEVNTSNDGFTMSGFIGCSPVTVEFTNNNPGLLAYSWDFGNGNLSTAENPAPQVYTNIGENIIQYKAWESLDTLVVNTLTGITINSMSNYGEGFPSFEDADAYYKIFENGVLFSQSGIISDTDPPVSWATSLFLDPTKTYTIEIWESDAGEFGFGADDYMGIHTMMMTGCSGCAAGTSNISYTITNQVYLPQPSVVATDTVFVSGYPGTPNIDYDDVNYVVSTDSLAVPVQWYFNGSPIANANAGTYDVTATGGYSLVAINAAGCVSFSDTIFATYCDPNFAPTISQSASGLIVTNPNDYTVEWFQNGNVVVGATGDTLAITTGGNYEAVLTNTDGCIWEATFSSDLGVYDLASKPDFLLYPNPSNGTFQVQLLNQAEFDDAILIDLSGRTVWSKEISGQSNFEVNADVKTGSYILQVKSKSTTQQQRVLIQK